MGRGRLAMKLIEKEKSRKATFHKRKNGIMKKAHELSTLCGVDSCLIIYSPNSDNRQPETWPCDHREVHRIIKKYEAKIKEKSPKKYDVVEFFKDRKNKVEAEACKLQKERLRMLYPRWDSSFDRLGEEQLRMFVSLLDAKIEDCKERINVLKKKRYLEEKGAESSELVASNRSHLSFMQNMSQTIDFSKSHQMMPPFDPNLMHLMMTQNDTTTASNGAFGFYDPGDGGRARNYSDYSSSSPCYYNNNSYSCLQTFPSQNNIMQYHHEANLQALPPLMMQGFQTNYAYHHDMLQAHQMFNYMSTKK